MNIFRFYVLAIFFFKKQTSYPHSVPFSPHYYIIFTPYFDQELYINKITKLYSEANKNLSCLLAISRYTTKILHHLHFFLSKGILLNINISLNINIKLNINISLF